MVPFQTDIELKNKLVSVEVEQVDRLADEDGFIGFDIRTENRRTVIYLYVEDQHPPQTPQEAEALFEAIHYPEHISAYSLDEDFTVEEIKKIAAAIRQHLLHHNFLFNKFISATYQPPLL